MIQTKTPNKKIVNVILEHDKSVRLKPQIGDAKIKVNSIQAKTTKMKGRKDQSKTQFKSKPQKWKAANIKAKLNSSQNHKNGRP